MGAHLAYLLQIDLTNDRLECYYKHINVFRDVRIMYSNSAGEGGGDIYRFWASFAYFLTKMAEFFHGDSLGYYLIELLFGLTSNFNSKRP